MGQKIIIKIKKYWRRKQSSKQIPELSEQKPKKSLLKRIAQVLFGKE